MRAGVPIVIGISEQSVTLVQKTVVDTPRIDSDSRRDITPGYAESPEACLNL